MVDAHQDQFRPGLDAEPGMSQTQLKWIWNSMDSNAD